MGLDQVVAVLNFQGYLYEKRFYAQEICLATINGTFEKFVLSPPPAQVYGDSLYQCSNKVKYHNINGSSLDPNFQPPEYRIHFVMKYISNVMRTFRVIYGVPVFVAIKGFQYQPTLLEKYKIPYINLESYKTCETSDQIFGQNNKVLNTFLDNFECAYHYPKQKRYCAAIKVFAYMFWLSQQDISRDKRVTWKLMLHKFSQYQQENPKSAYYRVQLELGMNATQIIPQQPIDNTNESTMDTYTDDELNKSLFENDASYQKINEWTEAGENNDEKQDNQQTQWNQVPTENINFISHEQIQPDSSYKTYINNHLGDNKFIDDPIDYLMDNMDPLSEGEC
jgi:hypothetical protein